MDEERRRFRRRKNAACYNAEYTQYALATSGVLPYRVDLEDVNFVFETLATKRIEMTSGTAAELQNVNR